MVQMGLMRQKKYLNNGMMDFVTPAEELLSKLMEALNNSSNNTFVHHDSEKYVKDIFFYYVFEDLFLLIGKLILFWSILFFHL